MKIADLAEGMNDVTLKLVPEPFASPVVRVSQTGWEGKMFNVDFVDETGLNFIFMQVINSIITTDRA